MSSKKCGLRGEAPHQTKGAAALLCSCPWSHPKKRGGWLPKTSRGYGSLHTSATRHYCKRLASRHLTLTTHEIHRELLAPGNKAMVCLKVAVGGGLQLASSFPVCASAWLWSGTAGGDALGILKTGKLLWGVCIMIAAPLPQAPEWFWLNSHLAAHDWVFLTALSHPWQGRGTSNEQLTQDHTRFWKASGS